MMRQTRMQFSCPECGQIFDACPPDMFHAIASRDEQTVTEPIKVTYKYGCSHKNIIYWGINIKRVD